MQRRLLVLVLLAVVKRHLGAAVGQVVGDGAPAAALVVDAHPLGEDVVRVVARLLREEGERLWRLLAHLVHVELARVLQVLRAEDQQVVAPHDHVVARRQDHLRPRVALVAAALLARVRVERRALALFDLLAVEHRVHPRLADAARVHDADDDGLLEAPPDLAEALADEQLRVRVVLDRDDLDLVAAERHEVHHRRAHNRVERAEHEQRVDRRAGRHGQHAHLGRGAAEPLVAAAVPAELPCDRLVLRELQLGDDERVGRERVGQAAQRAQRRDRVRVGDARPARRAEHDDVLRRPHRDALQVVDLVRAAEHALDLDVRPQLAEVRVRHPQLGKHLRLLDLAHDDDQPRPVLRVAQHLRQLLDQEERLVRPAEDDGVVVGDNALVVLAVARDRVADPLDDHAEHRQVEDEAEDREERRYQLVLQARRLGLQARLRAGVEKDAPREPDGVGQRGVVAAVVARGQLRPDDRERPHEDEARAQREPHLADHRAKEEALERVARTQPSRCDALAVAALASHQREEAARRRAGAGE